MLPTFARRLGAKPIPKPAALLLSSSFSTTSSPSIFSRRSPSLSSSSGDKPTDRRRRALTGIYADVQYKYPPKKVWPPDFSRLSPKDQFRLERKYKRRLRVATARPRWDRLMRMAQLVGVTSVGVYCLFFMNWDTDGKTGEGVQNRLRGMFRPESKYENQSPDITSTIATAVTNGR
ncbi:hypothetical protein F4810DRAFT_436392 [Camillea tinctor]|nr:hypothetical protein F4810DRAFT_436392 [Camillea tinctor]